MVNGFYFFVIFFLFVEFLLNFTYVFDDAVTLNYLFIYLFILFFTINFFIIKNVEEFNINSDILFKFYSSFFKNSSFFLNYVINNLKKIYLFLIHFRHKVIRTTIFNLLNNFFKNYLIIWRPLFKKFSYFGYFRSNRSKWIK